MKVTTTTRDEITSHGQSDDQIDRWRRVFAYCDGDDDTIFIFYFVKVCV